MSDSRQEEHRQANLVLLADDQAKVRSALRLWLSRQAGIQILGEAVDATGVIDWIKAACPDVILLDWELPGRKARELIADLRGRCPELVIVALSGQVEAAREARKAGVDAFVSKGGPPEDLLAALQRVGGWHVGEDSTRPPMVDDA